MPPTNKTVPAATMAFELPFFCDRVSYLLGRFGNTF
jgi:hypothetical protein